MQFRLPQLGLLLYITLVMPVSAATRVIGNSRLKLEVDSSRPGSPETISVNSQGKWIAVLSARDAESRVVASSKAGRPEVCQTTDVSTEPGSIIVITANCPSGKLTRRIRLSSVPDALDVQVAFERNGSQNPLSVEDRYQFLPPRRSDDSPTSGPLDFVWSQGIKESQSDVVSSYQFKSPVVMFQQGSLFTAIVPKLPGASAAPVTLDLDVTSSDKPWFSCGLVATKPYGHSYFRRSNDTALAGSGNKFQYSYLVFASVQPPKLGYRRMVRFLWQSVGHSQLVASIDLQRNAKKPELELFNEWQKDAWVRYAGEVYHSFPCGTRECGTLSSERNPWGEWQKAAPDAWFNSWFQTLRTAYGWYLFGRETQNAAIQHKAETILNLALSSPRQEGAFSTIYLVNERRWIREDGWAGFPDDYHAFCMSWTAYWMLRWAEDLTPGRKQEILAFVKPYGDFLVKHQLSTGVIPSWYDGNLKPRTEFSDFNAEPAGSGLFLMELSEQTGDRKYLPAAVRAMDFVTAQVLPRQRWYDFETFKSCARKNFDFYDRWTAQYPQNNLSTIQAAQAYLKLAQLTGNARYRDLGVQVMDYLLLTQQVWNNPTFAPQLVGGFTTQNTDAEWSDARQCYVAVLLWEYYKDTGNPEYLERAVAAARSTFAVAPWENWAHTGHQDEHGSLTGIHWGTGSAMTSVEMMYPSLGDAFIDVRRVTGAGFNACSLTALSIKGRSIDFKLTASPRLQTIHLKFAGIDPVASYVLSWNGGQPVTVAGKTLATDGYAIAR